MHGFSALVDALTSAPISAGSVVVLAMLFGWAGAMKLRRPGSAAAAIVRFRLVQKPQNWLARLLGGVEIAVAAGLLLPWTRRGAAVAAGLLSCAFVAVVAPALLRGERFACACLGGSDERIGGHTLWRAALMAAAATLAALGAAGIRGGGTVWFQGALLASMAIGMPLVTATWRRLAAARAELEGALHWDWIVQQSYPSVERRAGNVRTSEALT